MFVALFTVKIVLKTLGLVDYGLFSVIGGLVSSLGFLSTSMTGASQRFLAFEIGSNNSLALKQTFTATFFIFLSIALLVLILSQSIGFWFLTNKMIIPLERMSAAVWVYQFSIFSFILVLLTIPYQSLIIAREKIKFFAIVGILEALFKVIIILVLIYIDFDKLKLYSVLLFSSTLVISLSYQFYCRKNFSESKLIFSFDKNLVKNILGYATWNLIGALSNIFRDNGINILMNIFFGPIINASRAIAFQINIAIRNLIINFYLAIKPKITKAYASNNSILFLDLIFSGSKFSYYLILIITMPLLIETKFILKIWLGQVPEYSVIFTKLALIAIILEMINTLLLTGLQASGKIKMYQLTISVITLLLFPITYVLYSKGLSPHYAYYIYIALTLLCYIPQFLIVKKILNFPVKSFILKVLLPLTVITSLSYSVVLIAASFLNFGLYRFISVCIISFIVNFSLIFFLGISKSEKNIVKLYLGSLKKN